MVRREDIALAVADAVTAVPGVAELTGGPGVEVATFYSGGKVVGVHLGDEHIEVHIVADRTPLTAVADGAATQHHVKIGLAPPMGDRRLAMQCVGGCASSLALRFSVTGVGVLSG